MYYREDGDDNTICIISLDVDDILIAGNSLAIVQLVKTQLKELWREAEKKETYSIQRMNVLQAAQLPRGK